MYASCPLMFQYCDQVQRLRFAEALLSLRE